ncbi:hypothetical protein BGZ54_002514 [Gamsiella multidivaricata]|nr:hypothetical protein BGZ54_002514 [Gamsiella multidivaricata]
MIILALVMAIICNICILFRFLERRIWHSVILSLITATLQDILCIGAVIPFCILYPPKDYVYLEGFWTMIASMVFSLTATVLMSIDLHRTPNFRLQGSGVTHKQRILIAEAMSLCFYLAIGALIFIYLEHWTFLDALFFVMVTITTIGFGDRTPATAGGRAFVIFYAAGGIVMLGLVVNSIRYVILEDLHREFATRTKDRKAKREARRIERKEQRAREEEGRQRVNDALERIHQMESVGRVEEHTESSESNQYHSHYFTHFPRHFTLSRQHHPRLPAIFTHGPDTSESKSVQGIEESRVSNSDSTLGDESIEMSRTGTAHKPSIDSAPVKPQHQDTSVAFQDPRHPTRQQTSGSVDAEELPYYTTLESRPVHGPGENKHWWQRIFKIQKKTPQLVIHTLTPSEQREEDRKQSYRETIKEYRGRLRFSALMFMIFWIVGAIIFTFVESWDFGSSMYFVVIAFTTIGYGDFVPKTIAGRAIFLAYCLLGVVTLTSLASLIAEVLSKRMRKHVVESQMRRVERIEEAIDETHELGGNENVGLEEGLQLQNGDGLERGRVRVLSDLVEVEHEESEPMAVDNTCQGSLQQLVMVSKIVDQLLQKVLGIDYSEDEGHQGLLGCEPPRLPLHTPGAILNYLEKEEDASDTYLSPSISRDITSTSSIHRNSIRPLMHKRRHSVDPRSDSYCETTSTSSNDTPQFKITAWPAAVTSTPGVHSSDTDRVRAPSPALALPASATGPFAGHRHHRDGNITVSAVEWQHLIDYAKQFKVLAVACEETLQKVIAWEESEKKLRQRRHEARLRQKRLLEDRRRQLQELEESRAGVDGNATDEDLDEEEELEELEDWDEEGSNDDEEDEALDRRRNRITTSLLGFSKPIHRSRSRSRGRNRQPSTTREEPVVELNNQQPQQSRQSQPPHQQHQRQRPSVSLASKLQARLRSQDRKSFQRQARSRSRPRDCELGRRRSGDESEYRGKNRPAGHRPQVRAPQNSDARTSTSLDAHSSRPSESESGPHPLRTSKDAIIISSPSSSL